MESIGTIVQECRLGDESYDSAAVLRRLQELSAAAFNKCCDQLLAGYEFVMMYDGAYATEDAQIGELNGDRRLLDPCKRYTPAYITAVLEPIESPVRVVAAAITEDGYDKDAFLRSLSEMDEPVFLAFCLEARSLEYFLTIQVYNWQIPEAVFNTSPKDLCWRIDYRWYRDKNEAEVEKRFGTYSG